MPNTVQHTVRATKPLFKLLLLTNRPYAEMCVSKNPAAKPSKHEVERTVSEGKGRRGLGDKKQLQPLLKGDISGHPSKRSPSKCISVALKESILQDGIISLK